MKETNVQLLNTLLFVHLFLPWAYGLSGFPPYPSSSMPQTMARFPAPYQLQASNCQPRMPFTPNNMNRPNMGAMNENNGFSNKNNQMPQFTPNPPMVNNNSNNNGQKKENDDSSSETNNAQANQMSKIASLLVSLLKTNQSPTTSTNTDNTKKTGPVTFPTPTSNSNQQPKISTSSLMGQMKDSMMSNVIQQRINENLMANMNSNKYSSNAVTTDNSAFLTLGANKANMQMQMMQAQQPQSSPSNSNSDSSKVPPTLDAIVGQICDLLNKAATADRSMPTQPSSSQSSTSQPSASNQMTSNNYPTGGSNVPMPNTMQSSDTQNDPQLAAAMNQMYSLCQTNAFCGQMANPSDTSGQNGATPVDNTNALCYMPNSGTGVMSESANSDVSGSSETTDSSNNEGDGSNIVSHICNMYKSGIFGNSPDAECQTIGGTPGNSDKGSVAGYCGLNQAMFNYPSDPGAGATCDSTSVGQNCGWNNNPTETTWSANPFAGTMVQGA